LALLAVKVTLLCLGWGALRVRRMGKAAGFVAVVVGLFDRGWWLEMRTLLRLLLRLPLL
jgi:hypothetical protein